jgi:tetratricopeptide (TPR) repeat protein
MAYQSEIEKLEARYRENPQQWFAALADSYRKAGDLELALEVVRAGLEKRPSYVSGHIVLGRCLLDQKNDREAAEAFRRVLELDAENVIALRALAEISRRAGDRQETRRWLHRLLEVDPMNDEAKQELEELEAEAAEVIEATAAAGTGVEEAPQAAAAQRREEAVAAELPEAELPETEGQATIEAAEPAATQMQETMAPGEPDAVVGPEPEMGLLGLAGGETAQPEALEAFEPAAEIAEAPSTPEPGIVELEPTEELVAEATVGELETMEFVPPAESGAPLAAGEELLPFDEALAWGTGERRSRAIDSATLEQALEAREEALESPAAALGQEVSHSDLPLILPEELEEKPSEPAVVAGEVAEEEAGEAGAGAEPVVTETMAELYARQGLVSQARDIYRELVARRPEDARLAGRLAELEEAAGRAAAQVSESKIPLARVTGGESVRDFLARVLGGGPDGENPGEEGEATVEISGSPTRAAEDEISLAQIFGEEPAPLNPKSSEAPSSRSSGFSFDEFFASGEESRGGKSGGGEEEEGDDFTRWLKSLKS